MSKRQSRQMFRTFGVIFGLAILAIVVVEALLLPMHRYNAIAQNICTQNCAEKLKNAKEITLYKSHNPIKKGYLVVANGEVVAQLFGKTFPVLGDTYDIYDGQGQKPVLIESGRNRIYTKYGKLILGNIGVLRSADNEELGYIKEDILSWMTSIRLLDVNGNEELHLKKEWFHPLFSQFEILDNSGNEDYHITKNFNLFLDQYTIKVDNNKFDINRIIDLAAAAEEGEH